MRNVTVWLVALGVLLTGCAPRASEPPALRVLLIPADGGTEGGTIADYRPLFAALTKSTGIVFDLKVAQSYGAVVQAMCSNAADIAFVGPVIYLQASKRHCAELLGVAVKSGTSVYHAAFFVQRGATIANLADLKGRRVAFGDINSASSFVYPIAMLMAAGIDPARDLGAIRMAGSHASSLSALIEGHVDAAAMSFESYDKAVRAGMPGARDLRVLARSDDIPNPPLIMNAALPASTKARLRQALDMIAAQPDIAPGSILGYGGGVVDDYDTHFSVGAFAGPAAKMAMVDDAAKGAILQKAAAR
jgi:phosphonate transport system substrate-binding protein